MSDTFLVGNGAGFSGDRVDAPIPVVRSLVRRGLPAALFFEVLGERTVALAQLERRRDPELGYEPMLERLLEPVLAECFAHHIPILGNFGAANPPAAARLIARLALRLGLPELRIAVVAGDDVQGSIALDQLPVHEADGSIDTRAARLVAANAYIGAEPLVEALRAGADVVVAGPNALARARATADVLLERLKRRGLGVRARVDLIGVASVHDSDDGALWRAYEGPEPQDIRIRLAAEGADRDAVDQAAREVLALLCCGTAGTGGARWRLTPRILTRSYLVLRERVPTSVSVRTAREIAA
jgi:hypothetical protein